MFKLCKILIVIWTIFCVLGFLFGMHSVSKLQVSGEIDDTAAGIGAVFGIGFWFFLWFFPTLILGVLALIFKPRNAKQSKSDKTELCPYCGKYHTGLPIYCPDCGARIRET